MSLQHAANHLAAQGRGGDSTLVHMSPGEVKSLQQLAMAHGGSLSVNPNTGLPEAGFLSNILPMVIGAGITAATGGAAAPWMVGLGMGGLETLRTGNLNKGIMAGLGAYGGAGLAGGLMNAGTEALTEAASSKMTTPDAVFQKAMEGAYENPDVYVGNATQQAQQQAANIRAARLDAINAAKASPFETMGKGLQATFQNPQGIGAGLTKLGSNLSTGFGGSGTALATTVGAAAAPMLMNQETNFPGFQKGAPNPYKYQFNANPTTPTPIPDVPVEGDLGTRFGREQRYFNPIYTPMPTMAGGGPVEQMSDANAVGANTGFPMADIQRGAYATPYQQPISQNVLSGSQDTRVDPYTGQERLAGGGLSHLGDYSDGGRLLRGPGDGVSDSIPATIGNKQPARLADGEFVVPARIVSELGNGSTEAGARKLYAMMDRVQKARGKTVGKDKVAKNTRADKYLPA